MQACILVPLFVMDYSPRLGRLVPVPRLRVAMSVAVGMCLIAGFLIAVVLNSALAIRFEDKQLGPEPALTVPPATAIGPIDALTEVVLPAGHDDDPLLTGPDGPVWATVCDGWVTHGG